ETESGRRRCATFCQRCASGATRLRKGNPALSGRVEKRHAPEAAAQGRPGKQRAQSGGCEHAPRDEDQSRVARGRTWPRCDSRPRGEGCSISGLLNVSRVNGKHDTMTRTAQLPRPKITCLTSTAESTPRCAAPKKSVTCKTGRSPNQATLLLRRR